MQRGQVGTEYLMLIAVLLVALGVIFSFSLALYYDTLNLNKVQNSVAVLGEAIDRGFALGPGTVLYAKIELPDNVSSSAVSANEVSYTVQTLGGATDVYWTTRGTLNPAILPTEAGMHEIKIEVTASGVDLSEA